MVKIWRTLIMCVCVVLIVSLLGCSSTVQKQQAIEEQKPAAPAEKSATTPSVPQPTKEKQTQVASKPAGPKQGGTLNFGISKEISTMNPQIDTKSVTQNIRELMYESLLDLDDNMNIKPQLAERWEVSPDGKQYTFSIRKGVKFHDGKIMNAKDVKWTIEYVMDARNAAYGRPFFDKVQSVETIDDYTIKFTMVDAVAPFLSYLASIQSMAVVPAGSLETGIDKPATVPPGTGPFKYEEFKPGEYLALTRNNEYWGQKAYLDKVVLKIAPDTDVRFNALRSGDLDLIERAPYQWVRKIADGEIKGFGYSEAAVSGFRRIVFNVAAPPFDNVKLRQAVAYALDKQEILNAAYWGFGEPVNEKMLKESWWFLGMPAVKRDLAKTKQLLQEAGYDGRTLKLMSEQGQQLEAQTVQHQLAEAGIKTEIEMFDFNTYTQRSRTGDFEFQVYGGSTDPDPATTYTPDLLTNPQSQQGKRGSNIAGYSDPVMDELLIKLGTETNNEKRKEIYQKIMVKFQQDLPEIYIAFVPRFFIFKDDIKGFETEPQGAYIWSGGGLNHTWINR